MDYWARKSTGSESSTVNGASRLDIVSDGRKNPRAGEPIRCYVCVDDRKLVSS
jgi:hypothetical protein